ncbi:MAG: type II secretion system protein [Lachnospiraceae bacterium]|nr:type II secretion system protein [Lachnospiraceae bacterium]
MKGKRLKNDGFSLVELIVVVLIMAIIAVALAPQVMKWVENSRIASDLQTRADIENNCILAITEEAAFEKVKDGGYEIIIEKSVSGNISFTYKTNTGGVVTTLPGRPDPDTDAFWEKFLLVSGYDDFEEFENSVQIKSTPMHGTGITLDVHVYEGGYTFSELEGVNKEDLGVS